MFTSATDVIKLPQKAKCWRGVAFPLQPSMCTFLLLSMIEWIFTLAFLYLPKIRNDLLSSMTTYSGLPKKNVFTQSLNGAKYCLLFHLDALDLLNPGMDGKVNPSAPVLLKSFQPSTAFVERRFLLLNKMLRKDYNHLPDNVGKIFVLPFNKTVAE